MEPITFKSPWLDFDPLSLSKGFNLIPEEPGIYIFGYKIRIEKDGKFKERFCPTIVGQTDNLQKRLLEHWSCIGPERSKERFIFDKVMSQKDIEAHYHCSKEYDKLLDIRGKTEKLCNEIKRYNKHSRLLFYKNEMFFKAKGLSKIDSKILELGYFPTCRILAAGTLIDQYHARQITNTADVHFSCFYAIYAVMDKNIYDNIEVSNKNPEDPSENKRKELENLIKFYLKDELGIATTAKSNKPNFGLNIKVDLTCVRNLLVGLEQGRSKDKHGKYKYVNREYNYHSTDPLILPYTAKPKAKKKKKSK